MRFRDVIAEELARRQQQNPRYSLRGFARGFGVHHSTLSRLLNSGRPVHAEAISALGKRLRLAPDRLQAYVSREDVELVKDAIGRATFRPDSRWLASISGLSLDRVNIALQTLLRRRELRMIATDRWSLIDQEGTE